MSLVATKQLLGSLLNRELQLVLGSIILYPLLEADSLLVSGGYLEVVLEVVLEAVLEAVLPAWSWFLLAWLNLA